VGILFAHVNAEHAPLSFDRVVWMGGDKMNRTEEHNYLKVFPDLIAKQMHLAMPGKAASIWAAFAEEL
jgi:hypothetical protein